MKFINKKRKNPRTTPMNPELASIKPKNKYQMYRNLNSQSIKKDASEMGARRNNYKNIHEKYMQRAKEIEKQEKLKNELQSSRIDDGELPHIYKKSKAGVHRIAYDGRHEGMRDYLKSSHKYISESEHTRKPALMIAPRIVSHNSKESISSRGNIVSESASPINKNLMGIMDHKIHPYRNEYGSKSYKLSKIKGLPPQIKYNGKSVNLVIICFRHKEHEAE